jgi:hypothetical protein
LAIAIALIHWLAIYHEHGLLWSIRGYRGSSIVFWAELSQPGRVCIKDTDRLLEETITMIDSKQINVPNKAVI